MSDLFPQEFKGIGCLIVLLVIVGLIAIGITIGRGF